MFKRACRVCFYIVVGVAILFLIESILLVTTDFRQLTGCSPDGVGVSYVCGDVLFKTLRQIVLSLPNIFMLAPIVLYAQTFSIGLAVTPSVFVMLMAANVILLFAAMHVASKIWHLLHTAPASDR